MPTSHFFEHFPGIAWRKRPDGTMLWVSPRYIELLGFDPVGRNQSEFFAAEDIATFVERDRRVLTAGPVEMNEVIGGRLWHTWCWAEQNGCGPVLCGAAMPISPSGR